VVNARFTRVHNRVVAAEEDETEMRSQGPIEMLMKVQVWTDAQWNKYRDKECKSVKGNTDCQ
jgi:hypothetical protein